MTIDDIEIRIANSAEEKEQIYKLRYRIYIEEMGKKISNADHINKKLYDDLDDWGINIYAMVASEMVGVLRLNIGECKDFPTQYIDAFRFDRFQALAPGKPILSFSTRGMVSKKYRGAEVLFLMVMESYKNARSQNNLYNFILCAPELVGLYEQLGFRRYTKNFIDSETGYRVPMVYILDDTDYLHDIRSPVCFFAGSFPKSKKAAEWFRRQFPEESSFINRRLVNNEDFWAMVNNILHQKPEEKITILKDLTAEESQTLFKQATVLNCQRGDVIIKSGNRDNEMYIVLSGAVEVIKTKNDLKYSVAVMGPGDIFGEIAFVSKKTRTADVIAMDNSEILVLSQHFFERFMKKSPHIAARVLFNLSATLCGRLESTTSSWIDSLNNG